MRLTLDNLGSFCTSDGDCLLWDGATTGCGYPSASILGAATSNVRRWVASQNGMAITGKRVICICQQSRCLNVAHFQAMTSKEAVRWVAQKGLLSTPAVALARTKSARGRKATKLDMDKARAIRQRRTEGASLSKLSGEFGVSLDTCWKVVNGLSWRESVTAASAFTFRP